MVVVVVVVMVAAVVVLGCARRWMLAQCVAVSLPACCLLPAACPSTITTTSLTTTLTHAQPNTHTPHRFRKRSRPSLACQTARWLSCRQSSALGH
jgi:hypothetical protein